MYAAQGLPLGIVAKLVSEPPQNLSWNLGDLLVLVRVQASSSRAYVAQWLDSLAAPNSKTILTAVIIKRK